MSVPKGDRQKGKLEALVMLRSMCTYTIQICKNEKNFPKRDRWILTQNITREAIEAYANARKANSVHVMNMNDYMLRREYQIKARCNLEALLGLVEIAWNVVGLDDQRVEFWTDSICEAEEKLDAWRNGDRKRYAAILKDGKAGKAEP